MRLMPTIPKLFRNDSEKEALTHEKATIGDCHGQWQESKAGIPLFALYHPASIIYRRALAPVYEEDVLRLAASLPDISDMKTRF